MAKFPTKTYINGIIQGAMLSNSNQSGLMVCSSVDRGELVDTSWETLIDTRSEDTIVVRGGVEALEEREDIGVGNSGRVQGVDRLNHNV